jgi:hypothetical protein
MIQAGQYIDSTIGVSLGLATMTAAAFGQVVSDVSGVVFGGTLERVLSKLGLIPAPSLSNAQRQLSICRNVSMAGAVVGVIVGCALGATTLLLVDLEARHRIERATQLREIVTDMISSKEGDGGLNSETAVIYIATDGFELDPKSNENNQYRTAMKMLKDTESELVQECAKSRDVVHDKQHHILYAPIIHNENLTAVVEFRHNRESPSGFTDKDVIIAKQMARHIAIFMNRITE